MRHRAIDRPCTQHLLRLRQRIARRRAIMDRRVLETHSYPRAGSVIGRDVEASVISELGGGAGRETRKRVGTEADVQSKRGVAGSIVPEDSTRSMPHEAGPRFWL